MTLGEEASKQVLLDELARLVPGGGGVEPAASADEARQKLHLVLNPFSCQTLLQLHTVLHNRQTSTCVTINRNSDEKVNIASRKIITHQFLCDVFRGLCAAECDDLKPRPGVQCVATYSSNKPQICINPYHYQSSAGSGGGVTTTEQCSPNSAASSSPGFLPSPTSHPGQLQLDSPCSGPPSVASSGSGFIPGSNSSGRGVFDDYISPLPNFTQLDHSPNGIHEYHPQMPSVSGSLSSSSFPPSSLAYSPTQSLAPPPPPPAPPNCIEFEPVKHWCTVTYYENATQVGQRYEATQSTFTIDGYTDPANDSRFCLGVLTNEGTRDPAVNHIRNHIGAGMCVTLDAASQCVYIECRLSRLAIYVQSQCFNTQHRFEPHMVVKVPSGANIEAFSLATFTSCLQYNLNHNCNYETIFNMNRMCSIRVSFVKGWGLDYKRRKVTECPCWVDIRLNGALRMLDQVLQRIAPPLTDPNSNSGEPPEELMAVDG